MVNVYFGGQNEYSKIHINQILDTGLDSDESVAHGRIDGLVS